MKPEIKIADREVRTFDVCEFRIERRDGEAPRIVGHAAVFNQLSEDLGGFREQIAPGAFSAAIKEDDIRALFNHNPDHVLGRNRAGTLSLREDDKGLAIEIVPPDTQMARDLMISMDRGDITQMSFGFRVRPNGYNWAEDNDGVVIRTLTAVRLFDVSPVTYPAYPQTDVAVRSLEQWRGDLERASPKPFSLDLALRRQRLIESDIGAYAPASEK